MPLLSMVRWPGLSFFAAFGALLAGAAPAASRAVGGGALAADQALTWAFAAAGRVLVMRYLAPSDGIEVTRLTYDLTLWLAF